MKFSEMPQGAPESQTEKSIISEGVLDASISQDQFLRGVNEAIPDTLGANSFVDGALISIKNAPIFHGLENGKIKIDVDSKITKKPFDMINSEDVIDASGYHKRDNQ